MISHVVANKSDLDAPDYDKPRRPIDSTPAGIRAFLETFTQYRIVQKLKEQHPNFPGKITYMDLGNDTPLVCFVCPKGPEGDMALALYRDSCLYRGHLQLLVEDKTEKEIDADLARAKAEGVFLLADAKSEPHGFPEVTYKNRNIIDWPAFYLQSKGRVAYQLLLLLKGSDSTFSCYVANYALNTKRTRAEIVYPNSLKGKQDALFFSMLLLKIGEVYQVEKTASEQPVQTVRELYPEANLSLPLDELIKIAAQVNQLTSSFAPALITRVENEQGDERSYCQLQFSHRVAAELFHFLVDWYDKVSGRTSLLRKPYTVADMSALHTGPEFSSSPSPQLVTTLWASGSSAGAASNESLLVDSTNCSMSLSIPVCTGETNSLTEGELAKVEKNLGHLIELYGAESKCYVSYLTRPMQLTIDFSHDFAISPLLTHLCSERQPYEENSAGTKIMAVFAQAATNAGSESEMARIYDEIRDELLILEQQQISEYGCRYLPSPSSENRGHSRASA